jgi:DNA-binding NarL/FixJ family response regulator
MRVLLLTGERWRDMGIARALDRAPGINPILEGELGDQTWSKALASIVLVSEDCARTDAKRSVGAIKRKFPGAKVLVHGDESDPATIAALMAEGADGYFAMSLGEEKLVNAVRTVARGSVWMPRDAIRSVVQRLHAGSSAPPLTDAERSLLRMLAQGLTNKEMAAELGVAEVTVKTWLARLYRRFNVRSRVQLLSHAVRVGLLPRH